MNIENAKFMKDEDGEVEGNICIRATIDERIVSVPLDPANRHYQAIQEWVAEGNKIQEAE